MNTISITDMYMDALASLSDEEKLDLITKLTSSILDKKKRTKAKGMEVFDCFHKDWGGEGKPEEIAEGLRNSRSFNRDNVEW